MALFSIRVELHNATWNDYTNLASNLRRVGIVDTIVGDDGSKWKLPPAEYNFEGNSTLQQVFDATQNAARLSGRRFAVFTNEVVRRSWAGLARAF